jgi:hypothetical protein
MRERTSKRRFGSMRVPVFFAALVAGLALSATSLAGPKTTAPSLRLTVLVSLSDQGINLKFFRWYGGNSLVPVTGVGVAQRGGLATFNVINVGKKGHNFAILGKTTKVVKPGQRRHFNVYLTVRGNFPYQSTLDKGKSFRGVFRVV